MYKSKLMVLLLCLAFSGTFCYAHGEARTENMKVEGAILIIKTAQHGGTVRFKVSTDGSMGTVLVFYWDSPYQSNIYSTNGFKWSFNGPK